MRFNQPFANELSNPQFAEVLFDTTSSNYVYNFTDPVLQVTHLAPDWDMIVSGTGACTVTVSQTRPLGSLNRITNPGTLLNITSTGLSGKEAEKLLEKIGVSCNKNMIPFDTRKPLDPSGIRLGTPAITTR